VKGNRFLYLLVFAVGMGSLGAEIAAARLLAPYFGASTIVWANTIGVVLVALSIGYWLGGRFADRHPHRRGLCLLALVAAALIALVPFVAQPFFELAVDALDEISAGAFVGSLFAVLFLIGIPLVLLGACSPWAIRLAVTSVEHSGEVAGRLYAISTAGSLVGTMLSALVLIPFAGTQRTFLAFALVIALVAAAGLSRRWLAIPAVLVVAIALPTGSVKGDTEFGDVIFETETPTQYARVIEQNNGTRLLELNEGQAVHSVYQRDTYLTDGEWDAYLVLPFTAHPEPPGRIAILGNAAGSTARAYGHFFPETTVDGVEIDGELTDIGREYFDLRNPRLTTYDEDARPWLRRSAGDYDAIMVDAYRQPYIPFYLATTEFFELARDQLAPGGVLIVNAGHPEGNHDLETVLGRTMEEAFPNVIRDEFEPQNTMLIASEAPLSAATMRDALPEMPVELQEVAAEEITDIGPPLPGGEVYTDDRAPVEWLIDRSILGYAADGG
jgi:spermidine synthase